MRFATGLPGVNLYPPVAEPWEAAMGPDDFQLVARTAEAVGFHCIALPEHIVVPGEMVELMGAHSYVNFDQVTFEPKPRRSPHPPIIIGGNSGAAIRRAARRDGWFPWLITADELPACLDQLRAQPGFDQRTRPFEVVLPLARVAVDEDHRPLDGATGRARSPGGTGGHRRRRPPAVARRHPDDGPARPRPLAE